LEDTFQKQHTAHREPNGQINMHEIKSYNDQTSFGMKRLDALIDL